jgi:hypothetical protein
MNLTVYIERLILVDLPVTSHHTSAVRAAVEAELTRLFAEQGIAPSADIRAPLPHVQAGSITLVPDARPAQLGHAIAGALHRTLGSGGVSAPTNKVNAANFRSSMTSRAPAAVQTRMECAHD